MLESSFVKVKSESLNENQFLLQSEWKKEWSSHCTHPIKGSYLPESDTMHYRCDVLTACLGIR